jgi:hypothetical protein
MIGCCVAGLVAGWLALRIVGDAGDVVRMLAGGLTALAVIVALVVTWQKITPKSIKAAL